MKVPTAQGIFLNQNHTSFQNSVAQPLSLADRNSISFSHNVSEEMPLLAGLEDNTDIMI